MHGDMRIEVQNHRAATLEEQQAACDVWRRTFNDVRPHEALGMETPASLYKRSTRRYDLRLMPSVPVGCETRTVDSSGRVRFHGAQLFLSRALTGYDVGFRAIDDERYELWFYDRLLAHHVPSATPNIKPVAMPEDDRPTQGVADSSKQDQEDAKEEIIEIVDLRQG